MEEARQFVSLDEHLVFGASGAVGRYLLQRLHAGNVTVTAVSRARPPAWSSAWPCVHWRQATLEQLHAPVASTPLRILSAGPLDALAGWLQRDEVPPGSRLVALSSMSLEWKRDSPNPAERDLAARLRRAEQAVQACAAQRSISLVLLRPTLIYGAGIDRSLTPLLEFARRWRCLPWPRRGRGLRQPVHADDLAAAMLAALEIDPPPAPLSMPGGSTLHFDQLIDCLLSRLAPGSRRIALPLPVPGSALCRLAGGSGRTAAAASVLWRSGEDQLGRNQDWLALGLSARPFEPIPADFTPW